jgi:hypothetical protein
MGERERGRSRDARFRRAMQERRGRRQRLLVVQGGRCSTLMQTPLSIPKQRAGCATT